MNFTFIIFEELCNRNPLKLEIENSYINSNEIIYIITNEENVPDQWLKHDIDIIQFKQITEAKIQNAKII